jgi:hypothetical protein
MLTILKSITPESCENFKNKKQSDKKRKLYNDNNGTKTVHFDDEAGMNPSRYDKSDDIVSNNNLEIMTKMGFIQFGNKR